MAELQKDPITRKDFIGFGILGTIAGAILTIPPVAFLLGPVIKVDALGVSNVPSGPDDWFQVGPISEVPESEPKAFFVKFPLNQVYAQPDIQKESGNSGESFGIENAIWVSWKHEILSNGDPGSSQRPSFLDQAGGSLTQDQAQQAQDALNVLSSSCAHLGCPVRWKAVEGSGEFRCPCHGGIYNINGEYVSGPPPRGLYSYDHEVRSDGNLYVRHVFNTGGANGSQQPYVI